MADYQDKHDITLIWNPVIVDDFSHFLIEQGSVVVGKTSNNYFLDRDLPNSPVTAISIALAGVSGVGYFRIDGIDLTSVFATGVVFLVRKSTANDGIYTVDNSTYTGGNTTIYVDEAIPDSTNDGNILIPYTYTIIPVDNSGNVNTGITIYKTSPLDTEGLAAPENLYSRRTDNYDGMDLNWDDALDRNVKGYLIYRTINPLDDTNPARPINSTPTWSIVDKTTGNKFKDSNIPIALDPISKTTFVSYYVASYDIAGNVSAPSTVTVAYVIASIPDIRNILDYLSLNVYWGRPLPEDNIGTQAVLMTGGLYPSSWRLMGWAPSQIAQLRIEGYLVNGVINDLTKDTTYQVALTSFPVLTISSIDQGNKYIFVTGDYTNYFTIGDEISVASSTGNDQNFTIAGIVLAGGPQTRLEVNEAIPDPTVDGYVISVENQWLQPEIAITTIPDYSEDTTPPVGPINLTVTPDPREARAYMNWMKYGLENDFLNFLAEMSYLGAHPITSINAPSKIFQVVGDQTAYYVNGAYIQVYGSPENDGYYTVVSSAINGIFTDITVVEAIPTGSPTALGSLTNEAYWFIMGTTKTPNYTVNEIPPAPLSWAVTGVSVGSDYFEITGDYRAYFTPDVLFNISGSTGNNGGYSVQSSTYTGGKTRIFTNEPVPDATIDGTLNRSNTYSYRVRSIDRSGNISFLDQSAILKILWSDPVDGPDWCYYTESATALKDATDMRRYYLGWNDTGPRSQHFRQYIVYFFVSNGALPTPENNFTFAESEVLCRQSSNRFTADFFRPATATHLHIWVATEDWFGEIKLGPASAIRSIVI